MAYELQFYRKKDSGPSEDEIREYLTFNVNLEEGGRPFNPWLFTNEDTGAYFSFSYSKKEEDPEYGDLFLDTYDGFEDTDFSFVLYFPLPGFFGLEAFPFVEKFATALDLYVRDPQIVTDTPGKPTWEELFVRWNRLNLAASVENYGKTYYAYLPLERSNSIWEYNYNRKRIQRELGTLYFVPKQMCLKRKKDHQVVTMAVWPEHAPFVVPPADYFLLNRRYDPASGESMEDALITHDTMIKNFGSFLEEFDFERCRVIRPKNAEKAGYLFNTIPADEELDILWKMHAQYLMNAKPDIPSDESFSVL
jgi:hypothetical protein